MFRKSSKKRKKNTHKNSSFLRIGNSTKKRVPTRSKNKLTSKNYYRNLQQNSIYSSVIISIGFLILSLTIFFLTRQIQPFVQNERIKFLCTYQIGDRKNKNFKNAKIKLERMVGDSDKFCKNFIFPKEKNKRRFRIFPIMKDILFRFI